MKTRPLEFTPTYTVASVCTFYVVSSLFAERGLHYLSKWLSKQKRKSLHDALEKIKEELMLIGFISLLLASTADSISRFCVKSSIYERQPTPCMEGSYYSIASSSHSNGGQGTKHLEELSIYAVKEEFLASTGHLLATNYVTIDKICPLGQEPLISYHSLVQLHGLIFIIATTHIFYSCLAIFLALAKVLRWRVWEDKAHDDTHDNIVENTRTLKRLSTLAPHATTKPCSKSMLVVWVVCFFRQFGQSISQSDYLALRLGFIKRHHTSSKYDFHNYMVRSMEDDFKEIVGISFSLWIFVIAFLLFDVHGLHLYFWISFIPVGLILVVGMKLQHVIAILVSESKGVQGQYVRPRDELFWFKKPELLLSLIHFISFQNAFEMAMFLWTVWQFGSDSCLLKQWIYVYVRLSTGVLVQFQCSYSTLPLYALVTQMGSSYKKAIFPENIVQSLYHWHKAAKKKVKHEAATNKDFTRKSLEGSVSNDEHKIDLLPDAKLAQVCRSPANVNKFISGQHLSRPHINSRSPTPCAPRTPTCTN